jgi:hypothetical protein
MWQLAENIARDEDRIAVLSFFADFLKRVIHADPARTEALLLEILPRAGKHTGTRDHLTESIGNLVVLLWVSHERAKASEIIQLWLADPTGHESELYHGMSSIRDGLVLGYGTAADLRDQQIRRRCQQLAAQVVEASAAALEGYFQIAAENRGEGEKQKGRSAAKLLDHTSDQYYFASGAFRSSSRDEASVLTTLELKREFVNDNHRVFRRVGDVGTPHTIYHLIELLGFLIPADPPLVFDLVAHALLKAGRDQGYHFESLGADRFVEVIGLFLADHRDIFVDDLERRDQLVACLDAFVEAGWPAARRLLYRLPELLQ